MNIGDLVKAGFISTHEAFQGKRCYLIDGKAVNIKGSMASCKECLVMIPYGYRHVECKRRHRVHSTKELACHGVLYGFHINPPDKLKIDCHWSPAALEQLLYRGELSIGHQKKLIKVEKIPENMKRGIMYLADHLGSGRGMYTMDRNRAIDALVRQEYQERKDDIPADAAEDVREAIENNNQQMLVAIRQDHEYLGTAFDKMHQAIINWGHHSSCNGQGELIPVRKSANAQFTKSEMMNLTIARAFQTMFTPCEGQENVIQYMKAFTTYGHRQKKKGHDASRIGQLPQLKSQFLHKHTKLPDNFLDG